MPGKNINELLQKSERLIFEISQLQQQLRQEMYSINAIKAGDVDTLVLKDKVFNIYSGNTDDKLYRILIENMHEGAVTLNTAGTILYCNTFFARMLKLPLQKIIGTDFIDYIEASSKSNIAALLKKGLENALVEDLYLNPGKGKPVPVLMTLNKISIDNDSFLSLILTDLTIFNENREKLRQRTNQLEAKNKELEDVNTELSIANTEIKELIGLSTHREDIIITLSHDLRSPLAGIISLIDLLKESFDVLDANKIKEILDMIYVSSNEELNMLDYLLEWGRIKYASEAFSPTIINLTRYVEKVFNTLKENAIAKDIELLNNISEEISVYADEKMLLSILQNLVSNSIKYTPAKGKIIVSAERNEDKYTVEVRDTGSGMTNEMKEKLFSSQGELLKARKNRNSAGIGLLLVKRFVEKNRGEIYVETKEGEGSSFYFTLPVEAEAGNLVYGFSQK
jgi:signal transduction histidine kinase